MCQRSLPEGQKNQKNFNANIAPVVDSGRLFRSFTMQPFHFFESSRFFSPLLPIWRWYWDQSWVAVEFFIIDFHIFFLPFISPCQHSVNPFRRHFFLSISILFLKIYNVFIFFYGHFSLPFSHSTLSSSFALNLNFFVALVYLFGSQILNFNVWTWKSSDGSPNSVFDYKIDANRWSFRISVASHGRVFIYGIHSGASDDHLPAIHTTITLVLQVLEFRNIIWKLPETIASAPTSLLLHREENFLIRKQ